MQLALLLNVLKPSNVGALLIGHAATPLAWIVDWNR
jgi:hypothetical protein